MKKSAIIIYFLLCSINIFSQNLTGEITDRYGKSIIGVTISSSNGEVAITDQNGKFTLMLPLGNHKISFNHINFNSKTIKVDITNKDTKRVNTVLEYNNHMLKDIEIIRDKRERVITDVLSVKIINAEIFKEEINNDLSDIVQMFSGITLTDKQISIRGGSGWNAMAGSRVLVLIDDIPLLSGDMGQIPWDLIPIDNIDQIEVVKGAASAIYGSSAMNGVINVKTKSAKKDLIEQHPYQGYTQVNANYGFYNNPRNINLKWWDGKKRFYNADILHSELIGNTSLTIGANYFKDEGYRLFEENHRGQIALNLSHNSKRINGLVYGINGTIMKQNVGNFLLWESYNQAYIPIDSNVYQTNSLLFHIDPVINYSSKNGKHMIKSRYMQIGLDNSTNGIETSKDLYSETYYIDYKYKGWLELLSSNIVIGATNTNVLSHADIFNGNNQSNTQAIYGFIEKENNKTTLSFGSRYEFIKIQSEEEFSFEDREEINSLKISYPLFYGGIKHRINNQNTLRTYFGQGVRFPSIAEISTSTNVHGGTYIYPNLDLKPESGWSYELAYHYVKKTKNINLDFDIAYFLMKYKNMMEFSFAQWGTEYDIAHAFGLGFKTVNIGQTQISGIESEIDFKYKINKNFTVKTSIGYTYMNPISLTPDSVYAETNHFGIIHPITFNNSSSDNRILKYRYQHLLKLDSEIKYRNFNVGIRMQYNDYMKNIDNIFTTDLVNYGVPELGYPPIIPGINESREKNKNGDLLIDYSIGMQISPIAKLNLIINNATNAEIYTRPTDMHPPRTYSIKLSLSL